MLNVGFCKGLGNRLLSWKKDLVTHRSLLKTPRCQKKVTNLLRLFSKVKTRFFPANSLYKLTARSKKNETSHFLTPSGNWIVSVNYYLYSLCKFFLKNKISICVTSWIPTKSSAVISFLWRKIPILGIFEKKVWNHFPKKIHRIAQFLAKIIDQIPNYCNFDICGQPRIKSHRSATSVEKHLKLQKLEYLAVESFFKGWKGCFLAYFLIFVKIMS